MSVLMLGALMPYLREQLAERHGAVLLPPDPEERAAWLAEHGSSVEVAVGTPGAGVGPELLDHLPSLEAIVHFGVGYDTTDLDAVQARGVAVSNTPDVLTDCVADFAIGMIIDVLRRLSAGDRFVRAGRWQAGAQFPLTTRVSGKRVGILGMGRIGGAIAARLTGFSCPIGYHNRREVEGCEHRYHPSATVLARESDVLVVVTPGGSGTSHLVDQEVLDALGPEGYLVNISRGSVVDEEALKEALMSRRIAGAALDVFADEPNVPRGLFELDNVVLLPHLGSATVETRRAMADLVLENVESWRSGRTLVTPVP